MNDEWLGVSAWDLLQLPAKDWSDDVYLRPPRTRYGFAQQNRLTHDRTLAPPLEREPASLDVSFFYVPYTGTATRLPDPGG